MISTDERRAKAKWLMGRYEALSIGSLIVVVVGVLTQLQLPSQLRYDQALLHDRQILVPVRGMFSSQWKVRSIDLETGRWRESKFEPPQAGWVSDGRFVWSVGTTQVTQSNGKTATCFRPITCLTDPKSPPFFYEDKLAIIDKQVSKASKVSLFLFVLENGEWHNRGEIAVPADANPRSRRVRGSRQDGKLFIVTADGHHKVFYVDEDSGRQFFYRDGFDFVEEDREWTSAAESQRRSIGWQAGLAKIPVSKLAPSDVHIGLIGKRLVMTVHNRNATNPGSKNTEGDALLCENVAEVVDKDVMTMEETIKLNGGTTKALLTSPVDESVYFVLDNSGVPGSSCGVFRYRDGRLEALPYRLDCEISSVLRPLRWMIILIGVVIVVGSAVLAFYGTRLREQSNDTMIVCGHESVRLGSLNRRFLAKAIDLSIILLPICFSFFQMIGRMDDDWWHATFQGYNELNLTEIKDLGTTLRIRFGWSLVLWLAMVATQGWFGITPGKWLCNTRLVGTRLRPCGFARSLLREAMMVVDIAELGTYHLLVSDCQQRVGDQYADTVVVDRESLASVSKVRSDKTISELV